MKKVKLFEEFVNEEMVLKDLEGKFGIKLDVFNTPNYIELTRIEIPKEKRGQGIGTEVMELIIAFADAQDKPIFLTPSKDFGASSIPRLEKFYKGLGFVKNTDKSLTRNTMVKYPTNEKN
jgi:predicted GNAT family N-acyltransferase